MTDPTDRPPCYSDRYVDALAFAADRHRHQTKKSSSTGSGTPYITHLLGVSALIWEDGGDEDQAIAGLLHDVLEDTPTQADEVRHRFGDRVTDIVVLCTDANPDDGATKAPWRGRKEAHIEHLRHAVEPAGLRVVAADKVHNIEAQVADARHAAIAGPEAVAAFWAIFKGGFYGTLWYLRSVREAIGDRLGDSRLVTRFDHRLVEFAALHAPDERELELRRATDLWLRTLDPARVGSVRVDGGYYDMDVHELARRHAAGELLGTHRGGLASQYLKAVHGVEPPGR